MSAGTSCEGETGMIGETVSSSENPAIRIAIFGHSYVRALGMQEPKHGDFCF